MMLIRAEVYCHGWPDGNIPHGHVDVKVQRDEEQFAYDLLLSQLDRGCGWEDEIRYVDLEVLEKKDDDFDHGQVYAVVVGGEGEALDFNPVGKVFTAD